MKDFKLFARVARFLAYSGRMRPVIPI